MLCLPGYLKRDGGLKIMLSCPKCEAEKKDIRQNGTKRHPGPNTIKRYYNCLLCGHGWSSTEKPDENYYQIQRETKDLNVN